MRVRALVKALGKDLPHIIQSQHFYTNLYAAVAARMLGIREIAAIRNDCLSEVRANGLLLGQLSLRFPRVLVANSRAAIRTATNMGVPSARLRLLSNVVDTNTFKPSLRVARTPLKLVAAGRLVQQKRLDRFLYLLKNLREHSPTPVKGLIVGDGPLRRRLEEMAFEFGLLPGFVEFKGTQKNMTSIYQDADIFVLTSDWEGTPNVVLEAMAAGLPVVATRVGGIAEIIKPSETGELAKPGDDDELTMRVLELVTNPGLRARMGRSARDYVLANHSLQRLPDQLAEIYSTTFS